MPTDASAAPSPVDDPVDHLGLTDRQLELVSAVVPLQPLPVHPLVADRVLEAGTGGEGTTAGAVRVRCFTGPRLERVTAYRFQRRGILNEHLVHAWPAADHDLPALTTVVFETAGGGVILGADLIPIADVAFYPEYYDRWYAEHTALLHDHWPAIATHLRRPSPPPDPYFTNQLGSRLAVLAELDGDGLQPAVDYVLALTELWARLWQRAGPTVEKHRVQVEARRRSLMSLAYKGLDYHSPAAPSLASVLGWTGANLMFDSVFGPDADARPLDERRRYLDVAVSPGTEAHKRTRS